MVQNISECCEISFTTAISVLSVWSRDEEEACFTKVNINITPNLQSFVDIRKFTAKCIDIQYRIKEF